MSTAPQRITSYSRRAAVIFIILTGVISLFADMNYEGGRSVVGQYLQLLGTSAFALGLASGLGEFVGYAVRLISGTLADHTRKYWWFIIGGYVVQLCSLPAIGLVSGWRLAVVTNKPGPVTRPILEGLGIARFFGAVVGGGDTPALKPDPAPLRLAAERLGVTLDADDWMAGDNFTDLAAGRHAGLRRCFCRYGFGEPRDETWDLAIDRFADLRESLSR